MENITMLCTRCQVQTVHTIVLDGNGEFVTTCQTAQCGHFLKFPGDDPNLLSLIKAHNAENDGQVKVDDSGNPVMSQAQQDVVAQVVAATASVPTGTPDAASPAPVEAPAPADPVTPVDQPSANPTGA